MFLYRSLYNVVAGLWGAGVYAHLLMLLTIPPTNISGSIPMMVRLLAEGWLFFSHSSYLLLPERSSWPFSLLTCWPFPCRQGAMIPIWARAIVHCIHRTLLTHSISGVTSVTSTIELLLLLLQLQKTKLSHFILHHWRCWWHHIVAKVTTVPVLCC